jgi:hypothetical protein
MKAKQFWLLTACIALVAISATAYWLSADGRNQDHETSLPNHREITENILSDIFTSASNENPMWLEIQTGVTTSESVRQVLEAHSIEYEITGMTDGVYNVILSKSGLPLWDGILPEDAAGSINVDTATNRVHNMNFIIDLCISTIVGTFGEPVVEVDYPPADRPPTLYLHYLDLGLTFRIAQSTNRVDWIILHTVAFLREEWPPDDYYDWDEYAHTFAGECTDNVQALE